MTSPPGFSFVDHDESKEAAASLQVDKRFSRKKREQLSGESYKGRSQPRRDGVATMMGDSRHVMMTAPAESVSQVQMRSVNNAKLIKESVASPDASHASVPAVS